MASTITVSDVSFEFSNGDILFQKLNFTWDDRIIAPVSRNGIGKSCLARLLAGEWEVSSRDVRRAYRVSYLSPQRRAVDARPFGACRGGKRG